MASPLAAFRKYQKVMLVVFGVALIFVFTVGSLVSQYLGASPQGAAESKKVVHWKDGQLLENEMQMHRAARYQLRQFQQAVIQTAIDRGGSQDLIRSNAVVPNTDSEVSIVQSLLLAREAEQLGVIVSDDAILQHLKHLSDDTITFNELAGILERTTGGRMSQQQAQRQMFHRMRTELMAHQVRILANGAAFDGGVTDTAVSPGESFEYFKRLHRRMEAEVMQVAVADFVDQVEEEPTDAQIEELFEEYKDVYPSPISPTPGFRRPMRAAFQWLKADFQAFLDREIEKLTDQQIEEDYEANKNSYRKLNLPTADDIEGTDDPADEAASDSTDGPSDLDLDLDGEKPDGSDAATTEEADSPPAEADPAVPEGASSPESATEDPAASEPPSRGYQESEEEAEEDEQNTTAASAEAASDVTQPSQEIPSAAKDATALDVSDTVSETESDESVEPIVDDADAEEIEYQPLEEVRDDIARQLARPRATEALDDAVLAARAELNRNFEDYVLWDATGKEEGQEPARPDFEQLAEELGMVAGDIPLISVLEASDYDLGRAFELDFSTGQIRRLPFTQMGFRPDLLRYQPRSISAPDVDSKYVFWKVKDEEEYVPTLEQAREDVVRHWKMKKAIGLAQAQAEEYAKQVGDKHQSLQEVFGNDENFTVTDTGEFTWMTLGSSLTGSAAPRLSYVEGAEFVGEKFMDDVSALAAGELTVTNNYPETYIYVVYVNTVSNSQEELQGMFLNDGLKWPVLFMARQDNMQTATSWYESLEKSWGLEWDRPPDSGLR